MTAIVALVENGKCWCGGDSAGVADHFLVIRKDEKVFINGNFLIGCTSSFRMISLLRYSFHPPEQPHDMSDEVYMNTMFIDEVRSCFRQGGYEKVENSQEAGGTFLTCYKGKIFIIEADFQIGIPLDNFAACGSGQEPCLGSLYSNKVGTPEERILSALQAAEHFNSGVRGPFVIKSL